MVTIIEKALSFKGEERYQTCSEVKEALEALRYRPTAIGAVVVTPTEQSNGSTDFFEEPTEAGAIQPRWIFKTEDEIRCSPTAVRDMAFVGSYDNNVWALNLEDGELIWKYAAKGGIASSPVIDDVNHQVMFGSEDNNFYALDYRSGRMKRTHTTKDRVRGTAQSSTDTSSSAAMMEKSMHSAQQMVVCCGGTTRRLPCAVVPSSPTNW